MKFRPLTITLIGTIFTFASITFASLVFAQSPASEKAAPKASSHKVVSSGESKCSSGLPGSTVCSVCSITCSEGKTAVCTPPKQYCGSVSPCDCITQPTCNCFQSLLDKELSLKNLQKKQLIIGTDHFYLWLWPNPAFKRDWLCQHLNYYVRPIDTKGIY